MTGKEFKENAEFGQFKDVVVGMPAGIYAVGILAGKKSKINKQSVDMLRICAKAFESEEDALDYELNDDEELATYEVGSKLAGALGIGRAIDQEKAATEHTMWAVELIIEERTDPAVNDGQPYKSKVWRNLGKL